MGQNLQTINSATALQNISDLVNRIAIAAQDMNLCSGS